MSIKQTDQTYIAATYARQDVALTYGSGAELFDEQGSRLIDLGSGIAVNVFGAGDQAWVQAVSHQAGQLQHTSNYYYTQPQTKLAQALCELSGMRKVFFSNSGAEANECAIKTARKYASDRDAGQEHVIITLENSFHGRTLTTLSATGQSAMHQHFGPFTPGFVHVPANDLGAMKAAFLQHPVCAVMLEMVQGEGGVNPLDQAYVQAVAQLAAQQDALIIVDEVQTGVGRTGTFYAYQRYGIVPDIVTSAKGLGGGLPIGATLFGEKTADVLTHGTHGSTFGGNPVCCAGALSVVSRVDEALLQGVVQRHDMIVSELAGAKGVQGITGLGLMIGIKTEKPAAEVVAQCLQQGLLVLSAKDKVRLLPPLNIPFELLAEGLDILKEVIAS